MGIKSSTFYKLIILSLLLLYLPASAQRNRKLFHQNPSEVLRFDDSLQNKQSPVKEVKDEPYVNTDSISDYEKLSKKEWIISLVLPFNTSYAESVLRAGIRSANDTLKSKNSIPRETQIAIEFYKGAKMAITEYTGKPIKVQIFDDEKSEAKLNSILINEDFAKSDLVIGPVYNQNAKLMADYCKAKKIIHFNPLSPASGIATANPYHYKLFPSVSMHQKAVIKSLIEKHGGGKIYVYLKNNLEEKKTFAELFEYTKNIAEIKNNKVNIEIDSIVIGSELAKKTFTELSSSQYHTYFFCISQSDAVANEFARKLINHDELKCTGIGMPTWIDQDGIKLDYVNRAELYFPMAVFLDTSLNQTSIFIKNFKSIHKYEPKDNNVLGYDIMSLSFQLLSEYKHKLLQHYDEISYSGAGINFHFEPVKVSTSQNELNFDYFENTSVKFLKLQDYQLKSDE